MIGHRVHSFSRAEYYAIAPSLNGNLRYELLDGTIYARSPAKPAHAGIIRFLVHRFRQLDPTKYQLLVQDTLEIEPESSLEPDFAVLDYRQDFYKNTHPNAGNAHLVVEVSDTERNPREKIVYYMNDGRIPQALRIDIPQRCIELWNPRANRSHPTKILRGGDTFAFEVVSFSVQEMFAHIRAGVRA